ncbi:MAG TPA: hypothetical protein VMB51_03975 [Solirubrobacteraceae bacterium]|nr:hypothetical protein [Solirubrobacteraceae bacterium]
MRHFRLMTISIVAACALCALAAANASAALPEWGRCAKVPVTVKGKEKTKGKYGNANCTEPGTEYEFVKGASELPGGTEITNTMTSEKAELETSFGLGTNCTGETARGFLSGSKEVSDLTVTFTGCAVNLIPTFPCENTYEEFPNELEEEFRYTPGEIRTFALKGKLVYISGKGTSEPVVGLQLEPEQKKGWFAFFGCGPKGEAPLPAIKSVVGRKPQGANGGDKIVSPITPINAMGTETTQVYASAVHENPETGEIEDRGVQAPDEINGKPANLEALLFFEGESGTTEWGKSAQIETAVTKLSSGEELEIKA